MAHRRPAAAELGRSAAGGLVVLADSTLDRCLGCGGFYPPAEGPTHPYLESSPGCAAAAGKLFACHYENMAAYGDVYRLANDAYAVQHPGGRSRQAIQSVGIHLIRLCMVFEHGLPAHRANDAVVAAGRRKREFFRLEPPSSMGPIRVDSFMPGMPVEDHKRLVREWAYSAWLAWAAHHAIIRSWLPTWPAEQGAATDRGRM